MAPTHLSRRSASSECNLFSYIICINLTIGIHRMTIAQGAFHLPEIGVSFHGTPSTLALYAVASHRPGMIGTYQYHIGMIARTQESTLTNAEKARRLMTHQLHQPVDGEYALIDKFEHGYQ